MGREGEGVDDWVEKINAARTKERASRDISVQEANELILILLLITSPGLESSITPPPPFNFIVDTGTERTGTGWGTTSRIPRYVSEHSRNQRAGRAGRNGFGYVIQIYDDCYGADLELTFPVVSTEAVMSLVAKKEFKV